MAGSKNKSSRPATYLEDHGPTTREPYRKERLAEKWARGTAGSLRTSAAESGHAQSPKGDVVSLGIPAEKESSLMQTSRLGLWGWEAGKSEGTAPVPRGQLTPERPVGVCTKYPRPLLSGSCCDKVKCEVLISGAPWREASCRHPDALTLQAVEKVCREPRPPILPLI